MPTYWQKMRKLYLIILIGILWAFGLAEGRAQHQVVTGRLVLSGEQEKEEVLSYANVAVLGLPDSLLVKGTSSDKDGGLARFVIGKRYIF